METTDLKQRNCVNSEEHCFFSQKESTAVGASMIHKCGRAPPGLLEEGKAKNKPIAELDAKKQPRILPVCRLLGARGEWARGDCAQTWKVSLLLGSGPWGLRVETSDNGALCEESQMVVKSGKTRRGGQVEANTALLATKRCSSNRIPAITLVQYSPPPSIMVVSYSSYCEHSFCDSRENIPEIWNPGVIPAPNMSTTFHCPTCLALGVCSSAPSLPCPIDTTQCYQGKLRVAGGDIDSTLEVKGCTSLPHCGLMSGVFTIGPMWVQEMCPYQSLIQSRKVGNGATTCFPISVRRFGLLLPLLL
ncbi:testis-expressed protein 101-like [Myotis yumanensis]|uniref:testis-expressed protein 101-like n=1 Tax=Myotis yumanensis TaxID=159337 RepID=UPI0038D37E0B